MINKISKALIWAICFNLFVIFCVAIINVTMPRFTIGVNADTDEEEWVYDWKEDIYLPIDEFNKDRYHYDYQIVDPSCRPVIEPSRSISKYCRRYELASY